MNREKKAITFSKMHGAGNDYIYIDATHETPSDFSILALKISDVHFGIGSDGLVAILNSDVADFRMRMFNPDGSEAEMCGNASRCVGKYVYEKGLTDKTEIKLETLAGIKILKLHLQDGLVESVTVDMGAPVLTPALVPAISASEEVMLREKVKVADTSFEVTAVSMGNPHAVIFVDEMTDELVTGYGPLLEISEAFPKKANIEFAKIIDRGNIEMRVWERGTGETLACGTGACATAVAAVINGLTEPKVNLLLRGGTLRIEIDPDNGHVMMTGPAEFICDGVYYFNPSTEREKI